MRDQDGDIWIWDLARRTFTRLTVDPAIDLYPVWAPDGRRVAFTSQRSGVNNLYIQAADGTGSAERLTESATPQLSHGFTPDGGGLVFREDVAGSATDVHVVWLAGERRVQPLLQTAFGELNAEVSPDGRWIAYESNETGRGEVYVRPFPDADRGRWQVSAGGGSRPLWSRDGRELFYLSEDGRLTVVDVEGTARGFVAGTPVRVLDRPYVNPGPGRTYDIAPDGRFLMIEGEVADAGTMPQLVVVVNWFDELRGLAPTRD